MGDLAVGFQRGSFGVNSAGLYGGCACAGSNGGCWQRVDECRSCQS